MKERPNIFISYACADSVYAKAVAKELDSLGLKICRRPSAREAGKTEKHLRDALTSSSSVLVFVSAESLSSAEVHFELGAALGQGKRVIPVYLSNSARSSGAALPFKQLSGVTVDGYSPAEAAKKLAGMILTHPLQPGLKPRELEKFWHALRSSPATISI